MRHNFWGHEIPNPAEIAANPALRHLLERLLTSVGTQLGVSEQDLPSLCRAALGAQSGREYEFELKRVFRHLADFDRMRGAIRKRSEIITEEVLPFVSGSS